MSYVRYLFSDCSPQSLRANNFQELRLRRVSPLIAFIFQALSGQGCGSELSRPNSLAKCLRAVKGLDLTLLGKQGQSPASAV